MINIKPVVWYRSSLIEEHEGELEAINKHFRSVDSRVKIQPEELVIPRYSALPYFAEQEHDINLIGAKLINSYKEHRYIADINNWYADLEPLTFRTWPGIEWIDQPGPYILKGITNSRKQRWNTLMYAETLEDAKRIHWELLNDPLMQDSKQDIVIRKYEKLAKYFDGVNGCPVTKEFRFFFYKGELLSGGYYWANYLEDLPEKPDINEVPAKFLKQVSDIVKLKTNFWVVDMAQKESGDWVVVELNDASMSGLSCNDPEVLYKNLAAVISKE